MKLVRGAGDPVAALVLRLPIHGACDLGVEGVIPPDVGFAKADPLKFDGDWEQHQGLHAQCSVGGRCIAEVWTFRISAAGA